MWVAIGQSTVVPPADFFFRTVGCCYAGNEYSRDFCAEICSNFAFDAHSLCSLWWGRLGYQLLRKHTAVWANRFAMRFVPGALWCPGIFPVSRERFAKRL